MSGYSQIMYCLQDELANLEAKDFLTISGFSVPKCPNIPILHTTDAH